MFEKSKWIWAEGNNRRSDRIIVRKKFLLIKTPKTAVVKVAVSDGYNMYVNGKPIVYSGGLPRADSAYYDSIDIARYLAKGENVLVFECYYNGAEGNGALSAGAAGLLLECTELDIYSDKSFTVYRAEGNLETGKTEQCFYAGNLLNFDAGKVGDIGKVYDVSYGSTLFADSTEYGAYGSAPMGEVTLRDMPLFGFNVKPLKAKFSKEIKDNAVTYTAKLPKAMFFAPIIELTALGTEKIIIYSDRYLSAGSYNDDKTYSNGRIEYTCKNGVQKFESQLLLSGSKIIIIAPSTVKLSAIKYKQSFYNFGVIGSFAVSDSRFDKLMSKSLNTLAVCSRDILIDTPDRDRGLKLGSFSRAARAALAVCDDKILPLIKRTIKQFVCTDSPYIKNDPIGLFAKEIPTDSLIALSEIGAVSAYFDRTGDADFIKQIYTKLAEYLLIWEMEGDKLILRGEKTFDDAGFNIDGEVIQTALYYSACNFLSQFVKIDSHLSSSLAERAEKIKTGFEAKYFKETGYASGSFYDDRANAIVVLCGLNNPDNNEKLLKLLSSVIMASAQTEPYVLEAMLKLGGGKAARARLISRYSNVFDSDSFTLPEYFGGGAECFSGSLGIVNVLINGFGGLKSLGGDKATVTPVFGVFDELRYSAAVKGGHIGGLYRNFGKKECIIDNNSLLKVSLAIGGKVSVLPKGKTKNIQ